MLLEGPSSWKGLLLVYLNSKFRKRDKDTTDTNNNASDYCPDVRFKTLGANDHNELFVKFLRD